MPRGFEKHLVCICFNFFVGFCHLIYTRSKLEVTVEIKNLWICTVSPLYLLFYRLRNLMTLRETSSPPKKIYRCEPRAVNVCTCEDSGWAGCPHKHTYMLTHTSQTDPRKLALCKYRLRFRFVVSEREREREARWMESGRRKGGSERSGRGWSDFCGWGNKRGNRELESLTFNTRITK